MHLLLRSQKHLVTSQQTGNRNSCYSRTKIYSCKLSNNKTEKNNIKYFQGMLRAEFFLTCRLWKLLVTITICTQYVNFRKQYHGWRQKTLRKAYIEWIHEERSASEISYEKTTQLQPPRGSRMAEWSQAVYWLRHTHMQSDLIQIHNKHSPIQRSRSGECLFADHSRNNKSAQ